MKVISLITSGIALSCILSFAQAEPVMNLVTVNTKDAAGYAAWAQKSAPKLIKANNAMAMGLCSPSSGAEQTGDHYLWSFFDSQETAWQNTQMNPTVVREVAKLKVDREIRSWDNWRIVRAEALSDTGYYYNLYVETDSLSDYLAGLDNLKAELRARGHDITMQVFVGDTGTRTGTVMISMGAEDSAVLGKAMDARTEDWYQQIVSDFNSSREIVHGFAMTCSTYAMAAQ